MRKETTVVIIGGGATGAGILRDLSMRGVPALLFEQGGLCHGTSSRFHGLLHSGGRYAVSDNEAAAECIEENTIVRRIGRQCITPTEGFFVLTAEDDPDYVSKWVSGCEKAGIKAVEMAIDEALRLEPELNPGMKRVFQVPDAAVDGFRLVLHNAMSAERYGGKFYTYHEVLEINSDNGHVTGVTVRDVQSGEIFTVNCQLVVNAAGSWSARMVAKAGIHLPLTPDKGTLIVFNRRCTSHVINRLHKSGDGDIFVPNGSVTILGTTSQTVKEPDEFNSTTDEVLRLLDLGRPLFPRIDDFRILRVFAGTRPLYTPGAAGRAASRGFHISDHAEDGLEGLITIFGGKLTTYRLMAERLTDIVCRKLNVSAPCRTAEEALIPDPSQELCKKAEKLFLPQGVPLVADRLGDDFASCVEKSALAGKNPMVCECEMVSMAELLHVASNPSTHSLNDVRLRTRLGMGTCQGTFCGLRAASALAEHGICFGGDPVDDMRHFVQERWKGTRACYWGKLAREMELTRIMYSSSLGTEPGEFETTEVRPVPEVMSQPVLALARSTRVTDTVVVGSGLAGLFAALNAAKQGRRVTLISRGAGSVHISTAAIDVLGMTTSGRVTGDPLEALDKLPASHPYTLLGREKIEAALASFREFTVKGGWGYAAAGNSNILNSLLPTALGTEKTSALFPASLDPAPLETAKKILVCGIDGLRDSMPGIAVRSLRNNRRYEGRTIDSCWLPTPWQGGYRVETALDVARSMNSEQCSEFLKTLGKAAAGYDAVLLPPVAGILPTNDIWKKLCAAAGCPVVEMNGMPPGVTGMRLGRFLLDALRRAGVLVMENTLVTCCEREGDRVTALRTAHEDGERRYVAEQYIIATGGTLSGGLLVEPGRACDPVLGISLPVPAETAEWAHLNPFAPQPFALLGMPVLPTLEPTLDGETPFVRNVRYAGRAVAGQDTAFERSGNGIALATAYSAATEPWL